MKKSIITICFLSLVCLTAFTVNPHAKNEVKILKAEMSAQDWIIYLRNIERLSVFAGRNVNNSELLLATKDTVNFYTTVFYVQLGRQLDSTLPKPLIDSATGHVIKDTTLIKSKVRTDSNSMDSIKQLKKKPK